MRNIGCMFTLLSLRFNFRDFLIYSGVMAHNKENQP